MLPKKFALNYMHELSPMPVPKNPPIALGCDGYAFVFKDGKAFVSVFALQIKTFTGTDALEKAMKDFASNVLWDSQNERPAKKKRKRGPKPKLTAKQVDHVRWLYQHTSMSMAAIGRRFEVSHGTINSIINRSGRYA